MMCWRVRLLSAHLSPVRLVGTVASRTAVDKPAERLSATLAFDDPSAFRVKSWPELLRALGVFRFCSFPVLVNNSGKVRDESCRLCLQGLLGHSGSVHVSQMTRLARRFIAHPKKVLILSQFESVV